MFTKRALCQLRTRLFQFNRLVLPLFLVAMIEHCLREDLNKRAPRVMAVLRPIKVVLENYPEGQVEELGSQQSGRPKQGNTQSSLLPGDLHRTGRFS